MDIISNRLLHNMQIVFSTDESGSGRGDLSRTRDFHGDLVYKLKTNKKKRFYGILKNPGAWFIIWKCKQVISKKKKVFNFFNHIYIGYTVVY